MPKPRILNTSPFRPAAVEKRPNSLVKISKMPPSRVLKRSRHVDDPRGLFWIQRGFHDPAPPRDVTDCERPAVSRHLPPQRPERLRLLHLAAILLLVFRVFAADDRHAGRDLVVGEYDRAPALRFLRVRIDDEPPQPPSPVREKTRRAAARARGAGTPACESQLRAPSAAFLTSSSCARRRGSIKR